MTTSLNQQSAKILAFPVGGRSGRDQARQASLAADLAARRAVNIAFGSAWYHEEAVQNAERDAKQ